MRSVPKFTFCPVFDTDPQSPVLYLVSAPRGTWRFPNILQSTCSLVNQLLTEQWNTFTLLQCMNFTRTRVYKSGVFNTNTRLVHLEGLNASSAIDSRGRLPFRTGLATLSPMSPGSHGKHVTHVAQLGNHQEHRNLQ